MRDLLAEQPFNGWSVLRSVCADRPEMRTWYEFEVHQVVVACNEAECIQAIYFRRGDGDILPELPFTLSRAEVWDRLGTPDKSKRQPKRMALGSMGAWDLFHSTDASIRVEYCTDNGGIHMVTLMHPSAAP